MKPNWNDAPDWANWLAMDSDGAWYWYEIEPECYSIGWSNGFYGKSRVARREKNDLSVSWDKSLEQRPQ